MQNTKIAADLPAEMPSRPRHGIGLSDLENPLVQKALSIWENARGSRSMPSRADMSPRAMSGLLRNTVLVRVLGQGDEFEFRIVGDAIVQAQGASLQGMTMAQIDLVLPGYGSILHNAYANTWRKRIPCAYSGWYVREADGRSMFHESLVMPLGDDGETVDHILVVGVYAMQPGQTLR
ncbi:MAG TPA: PAS domain-containing protein [Rhizomicrobium sp.]